MDSTEISRCRKAILEGRILAYPTETVWGLGADLSMSSAVKKIFDIKGREQTKAVSLLVADIEMAKKYAIVPKPVEKLMEIFWPGPLTFVLPAKDTVPKEIHGGSGDVGLRCSSHEFVRELMEGLPRPVTTTSANVAGSPPARSLDELQWLPKDAVKVDWREQASHDSLKGSTVAKFRDGSAEILRDGDLPAEWLRVAAAEYGIRIK